MSRNARKKEIGPRRVFTREFKEEPVQMLLNGHSTQSVCERLGLSSVNLLYRWKKEFLGKGKGRRDAELTPLISGIFCR